MDTVMNYILLLIPLTFLIGGIWAVVMAAVGAPKVYENSKNPRMQDQIARIGKTKARILHIFGGLIMAGFGAYLLYCWLHGPIQR